MDNDVDEGKFDEGNSEDDPDALDSSDEKDIEELTDGG